MPTNTSKKCFAHEVAGADVAAACLFGTGVLGSRVYVLTRRGVYAREEELGRASEFF